MSNLIANQSAWRHNSIVLAAGTAGGAVLSLTGMPLAWMLGAMIATLLLSVRSKTAWTFSSRWRWLAQLAIAVHLGQQIERELFAGVIAELAFIAAGIAVVIAASVMAGLAVKALTDVHPATALFGTVPGGATEMAVIAEEMGGSPVLVALLQSIRMMSVIVLAPLLVWSLGIPATALVSSASAAPPGWSSLLQTVLLVGVAIAGWRIGKRMRLLTPALVGGVLLVALAQLAASWGIGAPLQPYWPGWILIAAQICLGSSIGIGFRLIQAKGGLRYLLLGTAGNLLTLALALAVAVGYAGLSGKMPVTAMLAFSPGGVSEMAIAAAQFHADSPFVAAVQLIRMLVVMSVAPLVVRWLVLLLQKKERRKPVAIDKSIRPRMEESE